MKLKKIASLALAGIMAVSMLAGCKDGGNSNSGSSSENTNTTSGYSAMLGQKAAETLSKKDLDEVFSFTDNADDQKALAKMVVDVKDSDMLKWVTGNTVDVLNTSKYSNYTDIFESDAKLNRDSLVSNGEFFENQDALTKKVGAVWVANGEVSLDNVMDKIYDASEKAFENADKDGTVNSFDVNYDYTVSVSVVNKELKSYNDYNGSINFIAVTVTRTSEFV